MFTLLAISFISGVVGLCIFKVTRRDLRIEYNTFISGKNIYKEVFKTLKM